MLKPKVMLIVPENPIEVGLLVIDVDTRASRLQIIERATGILVSHLRIDNAKMFKFVPLQYATAPDLIVIMLDDSNIFNAAIADNVQAQIVDLVTFDPNNLPVPL